MHCVKHTLKSDLDLLRADKQNQLLHFLCMHSRCQVTMQCEYHALQFPGQVQV